MIFFGFQVHGRYVLQTRHERRESFGMVLSDGRPFWSYQMATTLGPAKGFVNQKKCTRCVAVFIGAVFHKLGEKRTEPWWTHASNAIIFIIASCSGKTGISCDYLVAHVKLRTFHIPHAPISILHPFNLQDFPIQIPSPHWISPSPCIPNPSNL